VLGATRTFRDFVGDGSIDTNSRGEAVLGADDVDDFYRFTLGNNGPFNFTALTSNLTGNADLQLTATTTGTVGSMTARCWPPAATPARPAT
jgi:hypothetical protein